MVKKLKGKISKIENLTPDVKHFEIEFEEDFEFEAGQFVNLSFKEGEELHRKPYSIASHPQNHNKIDLCIKLVPKGKTTPVLWKKEEGDEVEIMGPLGLFTLKNVEKEKLVFIGTGTGIAPLRSMIKDILENETDKEIILIFGVRYNKHHLYEKEFHELEDKHPNFKFIKILSKPDEEWQGRSGHVHHNLDVIDPMNSQIFMCGLPEMIESSKNELLKLGVHEDDIKHEKYI